MRNIKFLVSLIIIFILLSCDEEVSRSPEYIPADEGFIFIDSRPGGAKIFLDDKFTGDYTPDSLTYLSFEEHNVTLKKEFFRDTTFKINLQDTTRKSLHIDYTTNKKMLGSIQFLSQPPEAKIIFNDSLLNVKTPHLINNLIPGVYNVRYQFNVHRDFFTIFVIRSNETTDAYGILQDTSIWVDYNSTHYPLPGDKFNKIDIDRNGGIWASTYGNGLFYFINDEWKIYDSDNSDLPFDFVTCVKAADDGSIWIGTEQGLVKLVNDIMEIYNVSNSLLVSHFITALFSHASTLWIGTKIGLVRKTGDDWQIYRTSNSGIPGDWITAIDIDEFENVWVGTTNNGIGKLDPSGAWTSFDRNNSSLTGNSITSISTKNGNVWVGHRYTSFFNGEGQLIVTNIGGLSFFNGSAWITDFGLTDDFTINDILITENYAYACSFKGLLKINNGSPELLNVSNSDLPHNVLYDIMIDKNNIIWLASFGGGLIKYKGEITPR